MNLRYVELLISSQNLVDYVDLLLKKERQSLNDSIIRNFMEFFYPKVSKFNHILYNKVVACDLSCPRRIQSESLCQLT